MFTVIVLGRRVLGMVPEAWMGAVPRVWSVDFELRHINDMASHQDCSPDEGLSHLITQTPSG